jgi:hypothetical protein
METGTYEIRALIEVNDNRALSRTNFVRVIKVDGPNHVNACPFHAAQLVLNHCWTWSTPHTPKNGGKRLNPLRVEVFIFSPSTVTRSGYAHGNVGASNIHEWNRKDDAEGNTVSLSLREWGDGFRSYASAEDQKINALPLYGVETQD